MNRICYLISFSPLVFSAFIWKWHGAHFGFWKTSVEEKIEVPIVDGMPELGTQTQINWEDRFVSGIETPLIGLVVTILLFLFFYIRSKRCTPI